MQAALVVEHQPEARARRVEAVRMAFPHAEVQAAGGCGCLAPAAQRRFDLALVDLDGPHEGGVTTLHTLRQHHPRALLVAFSERDDDDQLFAALQAGAFGYLLKSASQVDVVERLRRIAHGEPPLSPPVARRVLNYFSSGGPRGFDCERFEPGAVALNPRETDILQRMAKGYTLPEIAAQLCLSRHTVADYVKQMYRKLNVSSRAEAALEAARRGLVK